MFESMHRFWLMKYPGRCWSVLSYLSPSHRSIKSLSHKLESLLARDVLGVPWSNVEYARPHAVGLPQRGTVWVSGPHELGWENAALAGSFFSLPHLSKKLRWEDRLSARPSGGQEIWTDIGNNSLEHLLSVNHHLPGAGSPSLRCLSLGIWAWEAVRRQGRVSRSLGYEELLGISQNFPISWDLGYTHGAD